jgi:NAD(P)-dependent dehydrogenase (short-subunit alcohol dehydrogenase family)
MDYAQRATTPPKSVPIRLGGSIWRQSKRTPLCPRTPRLDGKLALVTGGNAGIGLEISRGLAKRGADVVVAARNPTTSATACSAIARETGKSVRHLPLDLSNLESVVTASERLRGMIAGRTVDVFVANAGIWPQAYAESAQGHEIAFATNTLGHHVLVRRMLDRRLLRSARVVILTGDIYIRTSECTSDFKYEGSSGGGLAYCRSKLGNLWFVAELQRRYPELEVHAVHPGVVASGLGGEASGFSAFMKGVMMLDLEAGAQTPLWCATQPNLERGGYYHNTMGLVRLSEKDPAADAQKASALWARLEELSAGFI